MRAYRVLLHLYPASFRAEYGEEMSAIFAQRRRDASHPLLSIALWIGTLFETLFNALCVHLDMLWQDLRYAARTLIKVPAFTFTAIVVAALGIGATTAAFTLIDHVLVRPLPFPDQHRLVKLWQRHTLNGARFWDVSPANYRDWKRLSTSFENFGAYRSLSTNLIGEGEPRRLDGASVTSEVFPTLGVQPVIGTLFGPEGDRDTAPCTMLLSHNLWHSLYAGDAQVLGKKVVLDNGPCTIIGVMPRDFYFPTRDAQLWTAMRFSADAFEDRSNTYIYGLAKLKPGVTAERAQTELNLITSQLAREFPKELTHVGATVMLLRDTVSEQGRLMLKALVAAALCVLLIACTNLANLLMARAMTRRKELAVRAALGAGRERLVRQMLTESLVLAFAGGVFGILIAISALPLLVRLVPVSLPIAEVPSIDLRVMLLAALLTLATGIGFGAVPALRIGRNHDASGLRDSSRSGGGRRERLRSVLVIAEVTGSVVLLVSCGLLMRAMWRIQAVDPGFRTDHVLTMRTVLPTPKYQAIPPRDQFYTRVLTEARSLPGVTGAGYTSFLPIVGGGGVWPVEITGRPQPLAERENASLRFVSSGYLATMGIPLIAGRDVGESDALETPMVAVVSQSFVRRYWPHEDPMGRRFNFGNYDRQVVGVAGDIRVRGLERTSEPQVYLPYKQHSQVAPWYAPKDLVIRATGNPAALAPALRRIVHEADAEVPVSDVRTLADIVDGETSSRQVQIYVLGAFAGIAFLLAAIGIHGLLVFAVSSRSQEIGVRIALGARPGDILGMILGEGLALAGAGILVGVGLAFLAGRAMESLLAGVAPGDLPTFLAAVGLAAMMTLVGSLLPALRAIRIDPLAAVRAE
jgi:predicted permease